VQKSGYLLPKVFGGGVKIGYYGVFSFLEDYYPGDGSESVLCRFLELVSCFLESLGARARGGLSFQFDSC